MAVAAEPVATGSQLGYVLVSTDHQLALTVWAVTLLK
jgi:hypothetical protein